MSARNNLARLVESELPPEQVAEAMLTDGDPLATLEEVVARSGLPADVAKALLVRVREKFQPVAAELRRVTTGDFLALIEDRAHRALEHLTVEKLIAAKPKDLAIILGVLLDKRQLLRGEPTAIIATQEQRQGLDKLVQALISEAHRRNMAIELRGPIVDVTPPEDQVKQPVARVHKGKEMGVAGIQRKHREGGEPL